MVGMEYQDIITAYKKNELDVSNLKECLEKAKSLRGRERFRTIQMSSDNIEFTTNVVNLLNTQELPEKTEAFDNDVQELLKRYFEGIVLSIKDNRAWKLMGISAQDYTMQKFESLELNEKFEILEELNKKYSDFLKIQKYADIRDYIKIGENVTESEINKIEFLMQMFGKLDKPDMRREFFCFDKKFLITLVNFKKKKSKEKRLEDYMKSKGDSIKYDYEKYSIYFSNEDYREIIDTILVSSKTLKVSLTYVIESFYELSETEAEEEYLDVEYNNLVELENKCVKMGIQKVKLGKKKELQRQESKKIENQEKRLRELKEKLEKQRLENEKKKKELEELKVKHEENKAKDDLENTQKKISVKEQVNPLIFFWFEREDITLTRRVGSKNLTAFFDRIKKIEEETGVRASLFLVTNAGKEVTVKRLQEFQKKARTNGLPRLVDGALGGYSSFRVDELGNVVDISVMSEENRNKIIKLLEKPVRFYLPKDIIEPSETNYLRYQFTDKRDSSINKRFLMSCIIKILSDERIKKQPLQLVPYIEKDLAGIDVLLASQLEGLNQLPGYFKSKYQIAPGRTLRVNIESINDFIEGKQKEKE